MSVRCYCCGASYAEDDDCPNVERFEHSIERAYEIASWLRERGVERPSQLDVELAITMLALDEAS